MSYLDTHFGTLVDTSGRHARHDDYDLRQSAVLGRQRVTPYGAPAEMLSDAEPAVDHVLLVTGDYAATDKELWMTVDLCVPSPASTDDRVSYVAIHVFELCAGGYLAELHLSAIRDRALPHALSAATAGHVLDLIANALSFAKRGRPYVARTVGRIPQRILEFRLREIDHRVLEVLEHERLDAAAHDALRAFPAELARSARVADFVSAARLVVLWPDGAPEQLDSHREQTGALVARALGMIATLSAVQSSRLTTIALRQAAGTERLQRTIAVFGSVVLVPTLIAGIFGANVDFPGANTRPGFVAMLVLLVGGAIGSSLLLWLLGRGTRPGRV